MPLKKKIKISDKKMGKKLALCLFIFQLKTYSDVRVGGLFLFLIFSQMQRLLVSM